MQIQVFREYREKNSTSAVFRNRLTSVAYSERQWVLQTPHQTPTEYCMRHFLLLRRQPIQFQLMWQVRLTASSSSRLNCSMISLLALWAMHIKCFSQRCRLHDTLTAPLAHALLYVPCQPNVRERKYQTRTHKVMPDVKLQFTKPISLKRAFTISYFLHTPKIMQTVSNERGRGVAMDNTKRNNWPHLK